VKFRTERGQIPRNTATSRSFINVGGLARNSSDAIMIAGRKLSVVSKPKTRETWAPMAAGQDIPFGRGRGGG
jgi:hypothetical protein